MKRLIAVAALPMAKLTPPYVWTYQDWDGEHVFIGCDERYRRTLLVRLPCTTRAIVFAISRPGKLYDPDDCFDDVFERWRRAYLMK